MKGIPTITLRSSGMMVQQEESAETHGLGSPASPLTPWISGVVTILQRVT